MVEVERAVCEFERIGVPNESIGVIAGNDADRRCLTGLGVGAASGGLISAFHNMAIPHEEAALYAEAVRRGGLMVVAEVNDSMEREVVDSINIR